MSGFLHGLRVVVVVAVAIGVPAALISLLLGFVRDRLERWAIALGSALCLLVVLGLVLGLVRGRFGFASWAVALAVALVAIAAGARARGIRVPRVRSGRGPVRPQTLVTGALVLAACVGAIVVARSGASDRVSRTQYVQLWILPQTSHGVRYAVVGASAHDTSARYFVGVSASSIAPRVYRNIALPNGAVWSVRIRLESSQAPPVEVDAELASADGTLKRTVRLSPAIWSSTSSGG